MGFVIQNNTPDTSRLPTASTCFNTLLLPLYSSYEQASVGVGVDDDDNDDAFVVVVVVVFVWKFLTFLYSLQLKEKLEMAIENGSGFGLK
jgi:hypothetical protein